MNEGKHINIIKHYESCLARYGDSHLGVDWPKLEDVDTRYGVMLDILGHGPSKQIKLLDFGCGASHLYEYILRHRMTHIDYSGLDLSDAFITLSRSKFPDNRYYHLDVLDGSEELPSFDYIVMNGVFTEKRDLSFDEMFAYFTRLLSCIWPKARVGMAFNVMSKHVEWERDDLFHVPFDLLASFLTERVSRHFIIRNDYGLYEYTVYVLKEAGSWKR